MSSVSVSARLPLPTFRRPLLSRCRLAGGLLGAATLALVAISPAAHVSAAGSNGAIVFGARICSSPEASENFISECDPIDPGAVSFASWDGATTLTMDQSVNIHGLLHWQDPVAVPLTDYHVDIAGLAIPDGYELWNIVPGMGEGGGSELGWYASLTEDAPETDLYALYVPEAGPDSDGDGASDSSEAAFGSDPFDASSFPAVQAGPDGGPSAGPSDADDSDGDGIGDATETNAGTDPYNACSFPDLDPNNGPSAGSSDCDDTDGDGAGDATEANAGTDPNDPTSFPSVQAGPEPGESVDGGDADGDQVSDLDEVNIYGTDPNAADTDGDGAADYDEIWAGADPLDPAFFPAMQAGPDPGQEDSDADSLTNIEESDIYGTDPNAADTDGDGASDFDEVYAGSDPLDPSSFPSVQAGPEGGPSAGPSDADDSDGDGAGDATETNAGTDPYDASSFPAVQAGPEPGDAVDLDSTEDGSTAVTTLPNTGGGSPRSTSGVDATILLVLAGGGFAVAGGTLATRRAKH